MALQKPPISTHVLDTAKGCPVGGLQVSLYKLIEGRWTYINEGLTNVEGRFSNFLERNSFTSGRYKLHYDVDRYFENRKQESLYPFIEVGCGNVIVYMKHVFVLLFFVDCVRLSYNNGSLSRAFAVEPIWIHNVPWLLNKSS